MEFQKGLPIPSAEVIKDSNPISELTGQVNSALFSWAFRGVLALLVIGLIYLLISSLVKSKGILRIGMLGVALFIFIALLGWLPISIPQSSASPGAEAPGLVAPVPGYELAPIGEPPVYLFHWVTGILILAGVSLCVYFLLHSLRKTHPSAAMTNVINTAIQAIQAGDNLQNVIIRCYADMERVMKQEHGIERPGSVTPREFEVYLAEKGIPAEPILRLTRLFERARYGNESLTWQDEKDALGSLEKIGEACQLKKAGTA